MEKINETIAIIPKEILFSEFYKIFLSINRSSKRKQVSEKCIKITKMLKDVIIKKEIDEKVDAYEKQLRFKYMKLIN